MLQTDAPAQAYSLGRTNATTPLGASAPPAQHPDRTAGIAADSEIDRDGFVGRAVERERLQRSLAAVARGSGQLVLIAGEPGIGKTRTAQYVASEARDCGLHVLLGRCKEEPGAPPYWPWVQAIEAYLDRYDAATVRTMLGRGAAHVADIVPGIRERCPDLPSAQRAGDPDQARFQLFDALTMFWKRVAAATGLVLILDNLHAADTASLRFLEFIGSEIGGDRLMVLGTYRDIELTRQHPLSNTLGELARHAWTVRIKLGGLSPEASARIMSDTAGREVTADVLAAVYTQTEGNPLFLQEMTRYLAEERVIGAGSAAPGASTILRRIPEGVREVIGTRLNRLSARCNEVLGCAAVLGRTFRTDLLMRITDNSDAQSAFAALEEAEAARVIGESSDRGAYEFTHALIRETLYDELSALRRSRLHQRVAAALEANGGTKDMTQLVAIAHHCCAALPSGDADKAIDYACRAAERADALTAYEESVRLYRMALQVVELKRELDVTAYGNLLLALGEALTKSGEHVAAQSIYFRLPDELQPRNDPARVALIARASIGFEAAGFLRGESGSTAARLIQKALQIVGAEDNALRAQLLSALGRAYSHSGASEDAKSTSEEAVAMARRLGEPRTLEAVLRRHLSVVANIDGLHTVVEQSREVVELATRLGVPSHILEGTVWRLGSLLWRGDFLAHMTEFNAFRQQAEALRQPFYLYYCMTTQACLAQMAGQFDESERFADAAHSLGQRLPGIDALGVYGLQMFSVRRAQGRLSEVAAVVAKIAGNVVGAGLWRPGLALIYAELGMRDEARREFEQLVADDFFSQPRDALWPASISYLAEVCAYLDDERRADTLYSLLLPRAGVVLVAGASQCCLGIADHFLGMLATTANRWCDAERHFSSAANFHVGRGVLPWIAHTQHQHAAMLVKQGRSEDRNRVSGLTTNALQISLQLGMTTLTKRLESLKQRLGANATRPANPARLSDREVEVLRLVAIGRSNKEIGKALFLSENTVANHVRNILTKTGCANRTEAAGFARQSGLA